MFYVRKEGSPCRASRQKTIFWLKLAALLSFFFTQRVKSWLSWWFWGWKWTYCTDGLVTQVQFPLIPSRVATAGRFSSFSSGVEKMRSNRTTKQDLSYIKTPKCSRWLQYHLGVWAIQIMNFGVKIRVSVLLCVALLPPPSAFAQKPGFASKTSYLAISRVKGPHQPPAI